MEQKYAKTNCNCRKCVENQTSGLQSGDPTNMSVLNCSTPKLFNTDNAVLFYSGVEPENKKGYNMLNPNVFNDKISTDFQRIDCVDTQSCPNVQYATKDPRLVSAFHNGQVLTLDRPAYDSTIKLKDISLDKNLDKYGQNYTSYSNTNGGYINYYVDKSIENPFYNPNFVISSNISGVLYQDPMSSMKPQYYRSPLKCNNVLDTSNDHYMGGLSWMRDSMEYREDLMARQMSVQNQQRWEPRWMGNSKPDYAPKIH